MNSRVILFVVCSLLSGCIPSTPNSKAAVASKPHTKGVQMELPAVSAADAIIRHAAYTASFNSSRKIPNWVAYELTPEKANGKTPRPKNSPFCEDPDYRGAQPSRADYHNENGWDKGHMAPCADMKLSNQTMMESFYFTNVCPQNHSINAGDWKELEELIHKMASQQGKTVYIICGPIITNNAYGTLGYAQVAIPDYFFKAVLYKDSQGYHSIAFVVPNEASSQQLRNYAISVNNLEKSIGINLFCNLDKRVQESVESQLVLSDWNL